MFLLSPPAKALQARLFTSKQVNTFSLLYLARARFIRTSNLSTAVCKLPTAVSRRTTAVFKLSTVLFNQPTAVFGRPTVVFSRPTTVFTGPTAVSKPCVQTVNSSKPFFSC
jgi:hypothetical protein